MRIQMLAGLLFAAMSLSAAGLPIGMDGNPIDPLVDSESKAVVLFFMAEDCPISNRYVPLMKSLQKKWAAQKIAFWTVYPNNDSNTETIEIHRKEFDIDLPYLMDGEHYLVDRAEATVTPECAVFVRGSKGASTWVYHGRINDQYLQFGKWRRVPTRNDLEDVISALVNGENVIPHYESSVGCYLSN